MFNIWVEFIICGFFIVIAGIKLCRFADVVAEKTGLGSVWIGTLLVAGATSLPELITTASSASLVKMPDMALGVVFGSCVFNLVIIVLLDFLYRGKSIFFHASNSHLQTIILSILLLGLAMLAVFTKEPIQFGWVGFTSILIGVCYVIGIRKLLQAEKTDLVKIERRYDNISSKKAWSGFMLSASVVIIFSIWISYVGERIAIVTGIKENLVGNIFLAISTSLPELVVSITAVRMGAIDMALANIFGSNAFNVTILPITDIFYREGPILADVNMIHLQVGFLGIILSIIVMLRIYALKK